MKILNLVTNAHGEKIMVDDIYPHMDREIMKQVEDEANPNTDQEWFDEYAKRHLAKFGEEWELNKEGTRFEVVTNEFDEIIYYDVAVSLMDDDIRESVAYDLAPCSAQEFFDEYCKRHEAKYNEPWELAKQNPTY